MYSFDIFTDMFIPFDLEALWSAVLVLLIVRIVDPSICATEDSPLLVAHAILVDMEVKGNMLAACRESELEHLDATLQQLATTQLETPTSDPAPREVDDSLCAPNVSISLGEKHSIDLVASELSTSATWNIDEVFDSQQLEAVANALDLDGMNWFGDLLDFSNDTQN
jgi:hypothetical protein